MNERTSPPTTAPVELTENQLDMVAGGNSIVIDDDSGKQTGSLTNGNNNGNTLNAVVHFNDLKQVT